MKATRSIKGGQRRRRGGSLSIHTVAGHENASFMLAAATSTLLLCLMTTLLPVATIFCSAVTIGDTEAIQSSIALKRSPLMDFVQGIGIAMLANCQGNCNNDSNNCLGALKCFHRPVGNETVPGCDGKGTVGWDYCYIPLMKIDTEVTDITTGNNIVDTETTPDPTTLSPTTLSPTTLSPTTLSPTTLSPTTLSPTTLSPTTLSPTSAHTTEDPASDPTLGQTAGQESGPTVSPTSDPTEGPTSTRTGKPTSKPSLRATASPIPGSTIDTLISETTDPFQLKLYWEDGYEWQGETFERKWCVYCEEDRCAMGRNLQVWECDVYPSVEVFWKFLFYTSGKAQLQIYDSDLCLELTQNRFITLEICDGANEDQKFGPGNGDFNSYRFELITENGGCVTQQHHPKAGEDVYSQNCSRPRDKNDQTSFWNKY